jgi:hypothetical protein
MRLLQDTARITGFVNFVHHPEFQILQSTTFIKMDMFPSSVLGRETPTLLGLLLRANLNHWTRAGVSLPTPEDAKHTQFPKGCFLVIKNSEQWIKSTNPVILSVMHHR